MSRLQADGLALIIDAYNKDNIGKVVRLLEFMGVYGWVNDGWMIEILDGVNVLGEKVESGVISAKHLMPLGDDYTQEILKKEKEVTKMGKHYKYLKQAIADVESIGQVK